MRRGIITGIDIGSAQTRVVLTSLERNAKSPKVIASVSSPTRGLRHGYITNLDSSLQARLQSDGTTDLTDSGNTQQGFKGTRVRDADTTLRLAHLTPMFDGNLDYTNVSGDANLADGESFFHVSVSSGVNTKRSS